MSRYYNMKRVNIDEEALKAYYGTHTYAETLREFNITGGVLDRRIKKWGIGHDTFKCRDAAEAITKDDLIQYYVTENHSKVETRKHFNITEWSLSMILQKYSIRKPKKESVKLRTATKLARYGNGTYNNRPKFRETYTERYGGIGFASEECKAKSEATTEARYGNVNIRKTKYFKDKAAQSKLERYGDPKYNNIEQAKRSCLAKYGVSNALQSAEVRERASQVIQSKYGVMWNCMRPEARHTSHGSDSKPNLAFAQFLDSNGVKYEREFPIANRSYDFKVGNTLIEIDPTATHNSIWGIRGGEPKSSTYHLEKSKLAWKNGYECIHIFDWDNWSDILDLIIDPEKVVITEGNAVSVDLSKYSGKRYIDDLDYEQISYVEPKNCAETGVFDCGTLVFKRKIQ